VLVGRPEVEVRVVLGEVATGSAQMSSIDITA
jgi:hypothetical protein